MPLPLPETGMTLHDIILKFVDLRDKLTMKTYKTFSELCEAGEDK